MALATEANLQAHWYSGQESKTISTVHDHLFKTEFLEHTFYELLQK